MNERTENVYENKGREDYAYPRFSAARFFLMSADMPGTKNRGSTPRHDLDIRFRGNDVTLEKESPNHLKDTKTVGTNSRIFGK